MAARLMARASPRRLVARRNAVVASSSRAVPCSVTPEGVATARRPSVTQLETTVSLSSCDTWADCIAGRMRRSGRRQWTTFLRFLDSNPEVTRDLMYVDASEYKFDAYNDAGLALIGDNEAQSAEAAKDMKPPGFTTGQWWTYLTSVMKLSPVPKDMKFGEIPEGVKRLGGTFVVENGKITAAWIDPLPGSYPEPAEVLRTVEKVAA
ncbi:hypothetical protein RI054_13g67220 [Pseudoscourfieldia marina]